ncbi:MAG: peptidylprolyl isomerase [Planctomycetota bacterium]|nr:peptidylprolyl isomerase [Planctomycetota bacterium]MEC8252435.1 peptidylprolyl isomerase [Planctomycetota bacterium]MEC9047541.1 peptidylprolyl isomerase [Planctomycetota bacterium]
MNNLMTLVCLPVLAASALLPAQDGAKRVKLMKPKASQEKAGDSKITKNDPAIRAIDKFIKKESVNTKKRGWRQSLSAPPKQEFQPNVDYLWHVETSEGALTIRYLVDSTPMHCSAGIYLARLGYYNGLNFHRIIPGFMAQGGCPTGTGTGGPGFFMDGEFPKKGMRKHDRPGLLSMANTGRPRSDGSQFFLTFVPTPHLDGRHTVWGEVIKGMDTVKKLEKKGTRQRNGMLGAAGPKIVRTWVEVVAKKDAGDAAEKEEKKVSSAVCVISGEDAEGGPTATFGGQTVAFCCKRCKAKWDKMDDAGRQKAIAKLGAGK